MLTPDQQTTIRRLLLAGWRRRQIANQLGVDRRTIDRYLHHPLATPQSGGRMLTLRPTFRCPGCGGRVTLPCVACRAARHRRQQQRGWAALPPETQVA